MLLHSRLHSSFVPFVVLKKNIFRKKLLTNWPFHVNNIFNYSSELVIKLLIQIKDMGRRQVVRHRFLEPTFDGSNPSAPAMFFVFYLLGYQSQLFHHRIPKCFCNMKRGALQY